MSVNKNRDRIPRGLPAHERDLVELIVRLNEARRAAVAVLGHGGAYGKGNPHENPPGSARTCGR